MKKVVYIATNPAYVGCVKIGYTDRFPERIKDLDTTGVMHPFKYFYACEIENPKEKEKKLHKFFSDKRVNPKKEFFRVTGEEVIKFIEAAIGGHDVTKSLCEDIDDQAIVRIADEIKKDANKSSKIAKNSPVKNRESHFSFDKVNIPIGAEIVFIKNKDIKAKVANNNKIIYQNEEWTLSGLATKLQDSQHGLRGTLFWQYKGEILDERRKRLEKL